MAHQVTEVDALTYRRSFWASLFTLAGSGSITLGPGGWDVVERGVIRTVPFAELDAVSCRRGFVWTTLVLGTAHGALEFRGLVHDAAEHLRGRYALRDLPARVSAAVKAWTALVRLPRWLNHASWTRWRDGATPVRDQVRAADLSLLEERVRAEMQDFVRLHDDLEARVRSRNADFLDRELDACRDLFDEVESSPLTRAQRVSAVTDEDSVLVVAGAGTGKTSSVVAKVAYAIERLKVAPSSILLLAYNKKAASELEERVKARVGVAVQAMTFHALGNDIIGEALDEKQVVSKLTEDGRTGQFVQSSLVAMLDDASWQRKLLHYFAEHLVPARGPEEFPDRPAFLRYLKQTPIVTLRGEQVRSHEEQTIANWLFVNGIDYEYERHYEHPVATAKHPQYRPDFYLPDRRIYLEHFGIDRDGKPATWIDAERYREEMEWKRSTHKKYKTTLVETFSYDRKDGRLVQRLQERLAAHGVRPGIVPAAALKVVRDRPVTKLAKLLTAFLNHFKEGSFQVSTLRTGSGASPRNLAFLDIFEEVHARYERALKDEKAIDFSDMIRLATEMVQKGRYTSPYSRIVVDEFQDLSPGRAGLLKALLKQQPDPRLVCVGDDWQSIYRFAGSNVSYMTKFSQHFGHAAVVNLDTTFRFGQRLVDVSTRFITRNPSQLTKAIRSSGPDGGVPVVIVPAQKTSGDATRDREQDVRAVLARIKDEHPPGSTATICVLGRYNHSQPAPVEALASEVPGFGLDFLTVHRAKGLEADYVIVLGVDSGEYGFPSEMADDSVLDLVVASADGYLHSEERRLFYVAMTRARRRVFILTDLGKASTFVEELLAPEFGPLLVQAEGALARPIRCPECRAVLVQRRREKDGGTFWGCGNFPVCDFAAAECECGKGAMLKKEALLSCTEPACTRTQEACPRCGQGALVQRTNGKDGSQFLGCTSFTRTETPCKYTRNLGGPGGAPRPSR